MSKDEKVIYIKAWLQKFGERNNETYYIQLDKWELSLHINSYWKDLNVVQWIGVQVVLSMYS